MKKKLLVFVIIAALVCAMMGITASAAPAFDKSVLRTFTEGFSVKEVMNISGEGDFEQTENKTFLIDVVEGTAASVSYDCTGDRADGLGPGAWWESYLGHENDMYDLKYMVLQVKNGSEEVGIRPSHVAFFDSTGSTTGISINGSNEFPVVLANESDGAYSRATVEYSVDGWYVTIPANFEGYVIIPVERLTSMPDDEKATSGAGDFISFHENDGYRYFWGIGMGVENHSNTNHATIEWINMFTIADTLDTGITGEVDEPTAAPDNTVAPTEEPANETTAPAASSTVAPSAGNSFPTWAWIVIGVAVVAIIVVVVVVATKKKKD